jgi:hypothetical protein
MPLPGGSGICLYEPKHPVTFKANSHQKKAEKTAKHKKRKSR